MMEPKLSEAKRNRLMKRLCNTQDQVVYFPVRHHSPTAAALVRDWIKAHKPAAVLIEGPFDYNDYLDELYLGHKLPIAIYSYFRTATFHSGVYYPFCEYSPEWLALSMGRQVESDVRFIDLPWSESQGDDRQIHRYADAELRRGRYVAALCERLQVEGFDDLWDRMIESQVALSIDDYLTRTHEYCLSTRCWEHEVSVSDRRREAFMAEQIQAAIAKNSGQILVVTGGFHSSALAARVDELEVDAPGLETPTPIPADETPDILDRGVALTTYSYERLDGLHGYDAGMPSPGFYRQAWKQLHADRRSSRSSTVKETSFDHQPLLQSLVKALRKRKQTLSTADLIAVETSAKTLAAIRGRESVWRRDLVDGVTSALIKDELQLEGVSPFLDAVYEVLRGKQAGRLAEGVRLPPLVEAIRVELEESDLLPVRKSTTLELDLLNQEDVKRSRLLHRLRVLEIRGFRCTGGTDFLAREEMQDLWESWEIHLSPDLESSCIEAARYGTVLEYAVAAKLVEDAGGKIRDASAACALLINASRCGANTISQDLIESLRALIAKESRFEEVGTALGHLLFLYCYDEAFGTTRLEKLGSLISETFTRALWLFEALGQTSASDPRLMLAIQNIAETYRRVPDVLEAGEAEYAGVLSRIQADSGKSPDVRGAAAGMLWLLGGATSEQILADMKYFSSPAQLGDFLSGLFRLAREVAQRHPDLVHSIDELLTGFDSQGFQTALPALRLAFTSFTPLEKHQLLSTLFELLGISNAAIPKLQTANAETAAQALALEERIQEIITKYGLEAIDEWI
ncbi:MAG: DUF5682 family protein [Planctomycetota bacterium]